MSRPSLAAALAVLALATVTVAAASVVPALAATPVVSPAGDGPNHLAINESDVTVSNTTAIDLDVGVAVSADSAALHAEYLSGTFQQAMANANTEANRTAIRRQMLARIAKASDRLRERNRAAIEAYAADDLTTEEFLVERARITTRADELHDVLSSIHDSLPRFNSPEDLAAAVNHHRGQLRVLQGPISVAAANRTARGDVGGSFYVEASDSGYTLAHIADGTYHRETFLGSDWDPGGTDQFATNPEGALDAALNRSATLYPWVVDNKEARGGVYVAGIYWRSWELPGGRLTVYLDGATTDVFREHQSRVLLAFNRTEVVNRTVDSVRFTVDRTYETGPAAVTLSDATTGEPLDGTVTIGDRDAESVGADGTVWFVEPRRDVAINATADGADFSVSV